MDKEQHLVKNDLYQVLILLFFSTFVLLAELCVNTRPEPEQEAAQVTHGELC